MQSSLVSLLGVPRRHSGCGYSRRALGHRDFSSPVSLRGRAGARAGQVWSESAIRGDQPDPHLVGTAAGGIHERRVGSSRPNLRRLLLSGETTEREGARKLVQKDPARGPKALGLAEIPEARVKGRGEPQPVEPERGPTRKRHGGREPLRAPPASSPTWLLVSLVLPAGSRALLLSGLGYQPAPRPRARASSVVSEVLQGGLMECFVPHTAL